MFSLVYKSKASAVLEQEQIQDILHQSRSFNKRNSITGCLLYYQGEFLQYLEGSEEIVLSLFERIKVDERHYEVRLLSYDNISERLFENWEMAYEDFLRTNHQLEYLKLYVSLFVEIPKKSLAASRTSRSFWQMVKKLITPESSDR